MSKTSAIIMRPFWEIPSPKVWPIIGHAYLFRPNGMYDTERLTEAAENLTLKYGPLVRLKFPGQEFIITVNADDASLLFREEGKYPHRPTLEALAHYRKRTFGSLGVVPGNGDEWHHFRQALTPLLKKSLLQNYVDRQQDIARSFVKYIEQRKNSENIMSDLLPHMMRYTIEAISVISPGTRVHCLSNSEDSLAEELICASCLFMDGLYRTYSEPPLWKIVKTKGYKKLEQGHNTLNSVVEKEFQKAVDNPSHMDENPFMKLLLNDNNGLSVDDRRLLATEVFLSGIDTVATTLTMCLYYLSRDKLRQELAYQDAVIESQKSRPYLRACIKETLRISSPAGGISRKLPLPVLMDGYEVPAGKTIIAFNSAISRMEKYFVNAKQFVPERWLREEGYVKDEIHPYASVPFGHGPRICPGRWLAEQEIMILLVEILKTYYLESNIQDVGMIYRMNRIPDTPVDIKFTERIT